MQLIVDQLSELLLITVDSSKLVDTFDPVGSASCGFIANGGEILP